MVTYLLAGFAHRRPENSATGTAMHPIFKIIPFAIALLAIAWLIQTYGNKELLTLFLSFSISVPLVYLVVDRFVQKNRLLHMKQEALRAELTLLKNQIDPHFFFNTLNNLYGLTVEKSDEAPRMILKLSELMRFTIYEGKKDHVPLKDEIIYLENYLEIQRLRTRKVATSFTKSVANDAVLVPPLLFIMLVENAFKHGAGSLTAGAFIDIDLQADTRTVALKVTNNFSADVRKSTPGIGLANLRRRLALLFPGRHQFETEAREGIYTASLGLTL